jgi:putative tryptophan/tyrosine transport system substrate-binding protein
LEDTAMLRRAIGLLVILTLGILWLPLPTGAQPVGQVPRIGILSPGIGPAISVFHEALRQGLRELGYVEGQSIAFEYRSAEGRYDQLPALAAELVALNVDVIVTWSTPAALAAKHATSTTPVVFTAVADPIVSGLITSFAQPGGNLTGVTHIPSELDTKRLELLKGALPSASRVAVLWHPEFPPNVEGLHGLKTAAQALRLELHLVAYRAPHEFAGAIAAMRRHGADALFVMPHPLASGHATQLADLVATHRLPAMAPYREFAEAGGLMAYGTKFVEMYRRAPAYVDKILKGTKASDIPVERVMHFELVINLKTAQALGLTIPPSLLFQADEVMR